MKQRPAIRRAAVSSPTGSQQHSALGSQRPCFHSSGWPPPPRHSLSTRVRDATAGNARELAPSILAIKGKLRRCDLVGQRPQTARPCVLVVRQEPWCPASVDATTCAGFQRNDRASRPRTRCPRNASMRRTKASQVYKWNGNLCAVQLPPMRSCTARHVTQASPSRRLFRCEKGATFEKWIRPARDAPVGPEPRFGRGKTNARSTGLLLSGLATQVPGPEEDWPRSQAEVSMRLRRFSVAARSTVSASRSRTTP